MQYIRYIHELWCRLFCFDHIYLPLTPIYQINFIDTRLTVWMPKCQWIDGDENGYTETLPKNNET